MTDTYTLLSTISLEPGTWADWFSGTMSFAAVVVALGGYWISRRHRQADERDRDQRAAESAAWKALQVVNDTGNISWHLRESFARSSKRPKPAMRFMHVQPLGIPAKPIPDLTSDEISALLRAKAAPTLMALADCISRYESIRYAMQEYKVRHEALFELLPTPIAGDGSTFTHDLDAEETKRALPYARMLDTLLNGIIDLVRENMEKSSAVLDGFGPAMKAHFKTWKLSFEEYPSEVGGQASDEEKASQDAPQNRPECSVTISSSLS